MSLEEYEENRVFVGGLSWEMDDRGLESYFRRFGKVMEAKVMLDRDTGRPRGFGFVTFADKRGMEDAIDKLHDRELDGRIVSVTKAQPKHWTGGKSGGYRDDYGGGPRGGYSGRGGGGGGGGGREDCFNCGQPGHWARDCPSGSGGGGGKFARGGDRYSSGRDRYGGGGPGYGGRYSGRDYGGDRGYDRYSSRDYSSGDRGYDRYDDGYSRESRYGDRDGGRDRYSSGGPARYEGSRYKDRAGPYDRPSGGRSVYEGRY
eukprot:c9938_g1_i1 orf=155-931(+)